jgi:hypothetical protein
MLNYCCLYFNVMTIADITEKSGKYIFPDI